MPTALGTRFVLYSFNPGEAVLNGFLQTLIGLYDYAHASGDSEAQALFNSGNAEAESEVPSYDTGAWSLYEPGQEDTLSYHQLVTGFLQQLCQRTSAPVYCMTAQHFESDLTTPPALNLLSTSAQSGTVSMPFSLSKISNVVINVLSGTQSVYSAAAQFPYGNDTFTIPSLSAGSYTVELTATDLAGNVGETSGALDVAPAALSGPPAGPPPPPTGWPGSNPGTPHGKAPSLDLGRIARQSLSRGRLRLQVRVTCSRLGRVSASLERVASRPTVLARTSTELHQVHGANAATLSLVLTSQELRKLRRQHVRQLELAVSGPAGSHRTALFALRLD